jgi:hypothetical protein
MELTKDLLRAELYTRIKAQSQTISVVPWEGETPMLQCKSWGDLFLIMGVLVELIVENQYENHLLRKEISNLKKGPEIEY